MISITDKTLQDLEFNTILETISALCNTEIGKEKIYLKDDAAKEKFLRENPNHKKEFQRLKGLGEMDWQELRSTTMDPMTRTLLQVTVEEAAIADDVMSVRYLAGTHDGRAVTAMLVAPGCPPPHPGVNPQCQRSHE